VAEGRGSGCWPEPIGCPKDRQRQSADSPSCVARRELQVTQVSRQVTYAIDNSHDFDAIRMRLKENQPPLVLQVAPSGWRIRMGMARQCLLGSLVDPISNLVVEPLARGWPAVDEGNVKENVVDVRFGHGSP